MPTLPSDAMLHALAHDLLEPGDALALRRAIAARPELARRWRAFGGGSWWARPMGSAGGALQVSPLDVLDAAAAEVVLQLDVVAPGPAIAWCPVVLHADGVLHPALPDAMVGLDVFAVHGDGRRLELVIPAGLTWLEVLLVPAGTPFESPDASAPWVAARRAAEAGELPGWTVSLAAG